MIANPILVNVIADLEKLIEEFEAHNFLGVPVVDDDNRMVGLAHRDKVMAAAEHRSSDSYLKASGIVGGGGTSQHGASHSLITATVMVEHQHRAQHHRRQCNRHVSGTRWPA